MSLQLIFILILCGVMTNIMSAIFGIGGGVLMVPILYTLFPQFPLQMIAATSLTIVMGSSFINLIYFYKQKYRLITSDAHLVYGYDYWCAARIRIQFLCT